MDAQAIDRAMMQRCIALSIRSGREGEYPYGVVISRDRLREPSGSPVVR